LRRTEAGCSAMSTGSRGSPDAGPSRRLRGLGGSGAARAVDSRHACLSICPSV
jgi:hypothetical protein